MTSIKNVITRARWNALFITAAAAAIRLYDLSLKPPHFDEGVNGWFVDQMTKTGYYHYDPGNYHGPLHFYILFLFQTLFGRHVWALRLPVVAVSAYSVYFVTLFDRFVGKRTALFAAAAMAVSPGAIFYGRYAIHESWLVFFLLLAVWGAAGRWKYGDAKYMWAMAMGVTGMILTKETYIIHLACFLLAGLVLAAFEWMTRPPGVSAKVLKTAAGAATLSLAAWMAARNWPHSGGAHLWSAIVNATGLDPGVGSFAIQFCGVVLGGALSGVCVWAGLKQLPPAVPAKWSDGTFLGALAVGAAAIVFFYSDAFFHFSSLRGIVDTYAAWARTGEAGNGHEKPWPYWLRLFEHYETPAMIGLIASPFCFLPGTNRLVRWIGIYGCGTVAAYSIVPYKTPWCVISLLWPFFFLFGALFSRLIDVVPAILAKLNPPSTGGSRVIVPAVALVSLLVSLVVSIRLNFFHYTDDHEMYVYVQTFNDIEKLMRPLGRLVREDPTNYQISGSVILSSYHPLPWLLNDFPNVGYYDAEKLPPDTDADFLLVEQSRLKEVESKLKDAYFTTDFDLRSGQEASTLFLRYKRFRSLFPDRDPDFSPEEAAPAPPAGGAQ